MHEYAENASFREEVGRFDDYLEAECAFIRAEMRGIADGAGVEYAVVLVSVYRKELGCTDVIVNGWGWGHNEDYFWNSREFRPLLILETKETKSNLRWMSVVYPFCLAGMTVGVNSAGLAFSVDNLTPKVEERGQRLASNVVCRLALDAGSREKFVDIVTDKRLATGRGFAFGMWMYNEEKKVEYVETGPEGKYARISNKRFYGHANHYKELDIEQKIGESSRSRQKRVDELGERLRLHCDDNLIREKILKILSDEKCHDYPIYRTGRSPDSGFTEFTAVFDLGGKKLELFLDQPSAVKPAWRVVDLTAPRWTKE
jgi:hypothetical protein